MDDNQSLELFSWHAFRQPSPREDFNELSRNVVAYCGELPLALEVLGSYLSERTQKEWRNDLYIYDVNYTELETTSDGLQVSNLSLKSLVIGTGSSQIVMDILGREEHIAGPSAQFQVPKDIDCLVKGIVLCVVYSSTSDNRGVECLTSILIINNTKCTVQIYKQDTIMSFNDEDWKNVISNLGPGDDVEIFVF
ncbi:unnamed protein product [Vicia faba]|uniref:Uncharacterized protein n=1 Tax=Vicia faba TaxID=3906 RepID=A0AAV1AEP0_VICFA|nr:unnamed protein product [Vicia faba]